MSKFKFIKITKRKKIRYLSVNKYSKLFVVFLHGFMSDLEGSKPKAFMKFCKKKGIGFLALEYSGHGKSSGEFTKGNITSWTKDAKFLIKKIVNKNNFILIGSSMGAWISLNVFKYFNKQICGFLGIGSAPEFLEKLMWNKFNKKIKKEIITKKLYYLKHGDYEYPISYQLIRDGRKNKVLKKSINSKIQITMIHGKKDEVVPVVFSKKILKIFKNSKKKLVLIPNGDHSLSSNKNLKKIIKELNLITKNI
tara:strand:+ start:189 stop:941 length:753 start_codon:yes stop_codon:yes gene_type:complete